MNLEDREFAGFLTESCAAPNRRRGTVPITRLAPGPANLLAAFSHHRPHAVIDGGEVLPVLSRLARALNASDTRLTFPRYMFVSWLVQEDLGAGRDTPLLSDELAKRLKERRPDSKRDPVAPVSGAQSTLQLVLVLVAQFLPALAFRLWKRGLVGRDTRWLRRQHFLDPAEAGGFAELAISLTRGRRGAAGERELRLLLTHAFLEDLRTASRPGLRRPWPWRRTGNPVLLATDAAGEDLLDLIADVRTRTGKADPVIPITLAPPPAVSGPRTGHPATPAPGPRGTTVPAATEAHRAPHRTFRVTEARLEALTGAFAARPAVAGRASRGALAAGAGALAVTMIVIIVITSAHGAPTRSAALPAAETTCAAAARSAAHVVGWVAPDGDRECVGYSGDRGYVFRNPLDSQDEEQVRQNRRLQRDQEEIFDQNARAGRLRSPTRPVAGLVYLAGLTAGRDDDYDSAEAEELEGLLVAQRRANVAAVNAPLLRVVVANGGAKMQDADEVAAMLVPAFAHDRTLLGVVGLDRSVTRTATAVALLNAAGIPTVATTLSADGIDRDGNGRPFPNYFAMSPGNRREAGDILRYLRDAVPAYFHRESYPSAGKGRPTRISIYRPPGSADGGDLYISTLVDDLRRESVRRAGEPGVRITTSLGPSLCGASSAVVYAGRHDRPVGRDAIDDFSLFLTSIAGRCGGDLPFVVADDGITRFVADPGRRLQSSYQGIEISYVSKGIDVLETGKACVDPAAAGARRALPAPMLVFCGEYLKVAGELRRDPGISLLWTGERVGLAYDAAEMFLRAAADIRDARQGPPGASPGRGRVRTALETTPYQGITGTFDYRRSHIPADAPGGRPLAVVRILISAKNSLPTCEYPGRDGRTTGPGPNTGDCP